MKKNLNIAYLNGAEGLVRKAASSGGSGGGSSDGESNWRYFDVSKVTGDAQSLLYACATIIKTTFSSEFDKHFFINAGTLLQDGLQEDLSNLIAVPINILMTFRGNLVTFKEACIALDIKEEDLTIAEISKEEFYSLE